MEDTAGSVVSYNRRSAYELIVKALVATAINGLLARHLARLRRQPSQVALYETIAATLIQTFPIAQWVTSSIRSLRSWQRSSSPQPLRFFLSAALDQRSLPDEQVSSNKQTTKSEDIPPNSNEHSIPLFVLPPDRFASKFEKSGHGRSVHLGFLSLLLMPLVLAALLYLYRLTTPSQSTYLDTYIVMTILSGLILTIMCIGITALNTTYTNAPHYVRKFKSLNAEPNIWDLFIGILLYTDMIDLHLSLFLGVLVQALAFMLLGGRLGEAVPNNSVGLGEVPADCQNPINVLKAMIALARHSINPSTSNHVIFKPSSTSNQSIPPRPCHGWDKDHEMGLSTLVEFSADLGYIVAVICTFGVILMLIYYTTWLLRRLWHRRQDTDLTIVATTKSNAASSALGAATTVVGNDASGGKSAAARKTRMRFWRFPMHILQSHGCVYVLMSYALISLAVYDLTSPRPWEPWMETTAWGKRLWFL